MKLFILIILYLIINLAHGVDGLTSEFDFANSLLQQTWQSFTYEVNEPYDMYPFRSLIDDHDLLADQNNREQLLDRSIAFFDSKNFKGRIPFMLARGPKTYFAKEYLYKEKDPKAIWENCKLPKTYKFLEMKSNGYKGFYKDYFLCFSKELLAGVSIINRPIIKYFRQEVQDWSNIPNSIRNVFKIIIEETFVYCLGQRLCPNTLKITDEEEHKLPEVYADSEESNAQSGYINPTLSAKEKIIIPNEEEKLQNIYNLIKDTDINAVIPDITNDKSDDAYINKSGFTSILKADIEDPNLFQYSIKWMKRFKEPQWWEVYKDAK